MKKETVLCVAALLAILSVFLVRPDREYLGYMDARVLALLFCLMTIMEGFKKTGLFERLANGLLGKVHTFRQLMFVLVGLCFFSAMWITNDVALLTFVPFTILVLRKIQMDDRMIPVITMETIAANLGSMATPVGNPQNLYLYSVSEMNIVEFLKIMGPLTILSLILIVFGCLTQKDCELQLQMQTQKIKEKNNREDALLNRLLLFLFVISILSVLRVLMWQQLLIITMIVCSGWSLKKKERWLPLSVDYSLLLTFVAFFVFIGNMGRIGIVRDVLSEILTGQELMIAFFCSQVISNVPAAILLSGFSKNYPMLLQGVNIGGLGTLIASLASLISYKFYAQESENNQKAGTKRKYFLYFTGWNVIMAVILLLAAVLLQNM